MSTKKISALTELTTTPAAGDLLPIVDISDTTDATSGTTKSIKPATLFEAAGIGAGTTAEPLKVDVGNGRLGIGAATPLTLLHLSDADPKITFTDETNNADGLIQLSDNGEMIICADSNDERSSSFISLRVDGTGTGNESLRVNPDGLMTLSGPEPTITLTDETNNADGSIQLSNNGEILMCSDINNERTASFISLRCDGTGTGNEKLRLDSSGNILLGGAKTRATDSVGTLHLFNGTVPAASATDGVVLYAEDVSTSELKVRDEAGNIATLSPHNFDLLGERSEPMAWSYSAKNVFVGKEIAVDMTKVIRALEKLTGESYVKIRDIADSEKLDWVTEEKRKETEQKVEVDAYKVRKAESDAHPTSSSTKAEIKTYLDEKGISYADAPKDELFTKVPEKDAFTEAEPAVYAKKSKPSWIG